MAKGMQGALRTSCKFDPRRHGVWVMAVWTTLLGSLMPVHASPVAIASPASTHPLGVSLEISCTDNCRLGRGWYHCHPRGYPVTGQIEVEVNDLGVLYPLLHFGKTGPLYWAMGGGAPLPFKLKGHSLDGGAFLVNRAGRSTQSDPLWSSKLCLIAEWSHPKYLINGMFISRQISSDQRLSELFSGPALEQFIGQIGTEVKTACELISRKRLTLHPFKQIAAASYVQVTIKTSNLWLVAPPQIQLSFSSWIDRCILARLEWGPSLWDWSLKIMLIFGPGQLPWGLGPRKALFSESTTNKRNRLFTLMRPSAFFSKLNPIPAVEAEEAANESGIYAADNPLREPSDSLGRGDSENPPIRPSEGSGSLQQASLDIPNSAVTLAVVMIPNGTLTSNQTTSGQSELGSNPPAVRPKG